MNRSTISWIIGAVLAVGLAAVGYVYFAGGSGEPSTDLTTPTIATETAVGGEPGGATTIFTIDQASSSATFEVGEVLQGSPNTVVGATSEVVGQFEVDLTDLSTARLSPIVVNARTFATDSAFRDRAIRGPIILNSADDAFELITFETTSVEGLTGAATVAEGLRFTITGDLTIKGVTAPATFDVRAELTDAETITGNAVATVLRSVFGIGIPNAPGVADVNDEVTIGIDFVARAG